MATPADVRTAEQRIRQKARDDLSLLVNNELTAVLANIASTLPPGSVINDTPVTISIANRSLTLPLVTIMVAIRISIISNYRDAVGDQAIADFLTRYDEFIAANPLP